VRVQSGSGKVKANGPAMRSLDERKHFTDLIESIEVDWGWTVLAGNLSAEATDQPGGLAPDPFMRIAHGLAISKYLLRISSVQVHHALGHEHGGKADQECDQANIYPGEA